MKRLQDHKQKSPNKWPYKHPHIYPQRRAPSWASLRVDKTLRDFLVIPLNSQWETKINEKPCQIQVDIKGTLFNIHSEAYRCNPGKIVRSWQRMRILARITSPEHVSSAQLRKVKFNVIPSFPNPDPLVINPSSPRDSYCLLVCLSGS